MVSAIAATAFAATAIAATAAAVPIALAIATTASAVAAAPIGVSPAEPIRATVLSIGDGDSIRVSHGGKLLTIRLACIDAPELAQVPHGQHSRDYLRTRLPRGAAVMILPHTLDRYGRTVAEVIGEINVSLAMVEDGQAFAYRRYLDSCDAREYLEAEFRASRHRYGVWQVPGGITRPWDFRASPSK